jgi:hypothetical protein
MVLASAFGAATSLLKPCLEASRPRCSNCLNASKVSGVTSSSSEPNKPLSVFPIIPPPVTKFAKPCTAPGIVAPIFLLLPY